MRNPQYLVVYKDNPKAKAHIFGPFVNQTIADEFKEDLPQPLQGGYKIRKYTEPHTSSEAREASARLVAQRNRELVS